MRKRELLRLRLRDERFIRRHDKQSLTKDELVVGRFLARGSASQRSTSFRAGTLGRSKGGLEVGRPWREAAASTQTLFRGAQKLIRSSPKLRVEVAETVDSARRFR